ncbi:glutamine synthetase III [Clostridium vincentii]|uniref:Glutamine synthetase n=1 Tax=Clostridium vincentii TaxID=52704 RepID=A0A2T0B6N1_9CLOT|nr:glutamine synthetase III [Clostridium vincentii]PRR79525.1 Glutamine synthetase [Clostridium vincentii]
MENKNRIPELFGSMVFNENTMKERLPKQIYKDLKKAIANNMTLDLGVANIVANAMKDWALEKGVTHFTHWFQPMTGITAEKHDAFISPTNDGEILMEFSGKELIQGEPDASSFPSGGLRATFEARGYTAWDPSSPAFIKDNVLCIPTVFYSYTGEALDKKTPLLRSMEALNIQALRVLKLFGRDEVSRVSTTVGPEQEYFLIDKKYYDQRLDLMLTGRTLLGAMPPKGQEMDDHYFGNIKTRIAVYMEDLDRELWKVGILAKTKHNEVAPAQHELAPIFNLSNVSTDHNQLTMELMKKVAERHGLVCLLHEKPFEGINGSGKHNNWSLSTNLGENLLEPGKNPEENLQFVTFLCAVIKAVDDYQDLLRISVANAGNDHRLGANEAPPAIVSMYLGAHLNEVLASIENGSNYSSKKEERMELGVDIIPKFAKDTSDRNRTSPFAFTGNKFEFRMLGSTFSISCCNVMLNTSVAESLCQFADELEGKEDFKTSLNSLLKRTIKENKKIIFNGNGYAEEWVVEAEKRGLLNLKTTVDALPHYIKEKNLSLFEKHHIYTKNEIHSRYEILLEEYSKVINIEGLTTVEMVRRQLLPAITSFMKELSDTIISKKAVGLSTSCDMERGILTQVSTLANKLYEEVEKLNTLIGKGVDYADAYENANFFKEQIIPVMEATRLAADSLEGLVGQSYWPLPSYSDLIYRI